MICPDSVFSLKAQQDRGSCSSGGVPKIQCHSELLNALLTFQ